MMFRRSARALPLLLSVALVACEATHDMVGTGPVSLTAAQQDHFRKWQSGDAARDPLFFFLTKSGGVWYSWCPETQAICKEATDFDSLQRCEEQNGKDGCRLYAAYGQVVWKTDAPPDPDWTRAR